jgi:hypothetical protein
MRHSLDYSPLSPRLKIERADKHIDDLYDVLKGFLSSDFYSVRIDKNYWFNDLIIDISKDFPKEVASLMLGDAIHNLRSSLDVLMRQTVINMNGIPSKKTAFPFADSREKLIEETNSRLKEPAMEEVRDFIIDEIKPYQTGNYPLWAIHDLDIRDKHHFIIPVIELMLFRDIRFDDEKQVAHSRNVFTQSSTSVRLEPFHKFELKDKGHPAAQILFPPDVPFEAKPVIPELHNLSKVCGGVIEAFEKLLGRGL